MYDVLVYIGRFQPVHNAHVETIRRASKLAKKLVIICGSANQPRTYKNPWTFEERKYLIDIVCKDVMSPTLCQHVIEPNIDSVYNDSAWVERIQEIVSRNSRPNDKIGIIGHKKDSSSFYLDMFPQWDFVDTPLIEPLNATDIRGLFFKENCNMNFIRGVVPSVVYNFLHNFGLSPEYTSILNERKFIDTYKKQFEHLAYPPIFVTVDAVVLCSGHILLVKRKSEPGKGLWALPGGFLNAYTDKSVKSAMLRELREETKIKVPEPVLAGSITDKEVFDAVDRSARGRTITHAFKIELPAGTLPKIKGSDDAEKALWVPLNEVTSENMFEDHFDIINYFVG